MTTKPQIGDDTLLCTELWPGNWGDQGLKNTGEEKKERSPVWKEGKRRGAYIPGGRGNSLLKTGELGGAYKEE